MNGFSNAIELLARSGTVTNSGSAGAALTAGSGNGSTTFSGVLEDSTASLGLIKVGTGALELGGANTYSGTTTLSAGRLLAGSTTALSSSSAFTVNSILDLNGFSNTVASLAGTGTVTNGGSLSEAVSGSSDWSPAILTAGGDGTSTVFSGTLIDGTGSLGFEQNRGRNADPDRNEYLYGRHNRYGWNLTDRQWGGRRQHRGRCAEQFCAGS